MRKYLGVIYFGIGLIGVCIYECIYIFIYKDNNLNNGL